MKQKETFFFIKGILQTLRSFFALKRTYFFNRHSMEGKGSSTGLYFTL